MSLLNTLKAITSHPLNRHQKIAALLRFLRWQVGIRLVPGQVAFEWIDGIRAIVRRGDHGMTLNVYCGLSDFHDMAYLLHVLRPGDLFVDIGANVGSYTLLACGVAGADGYCFEPVPSTFANLHTNLLVNHLSSRVAAFNLGLAESEGELFFTAGENATNHVVSSHESSDGTIRVPVQTLDTVLNERCPGIIKIDVEGFETPVLAGAENTLANPKLHSVIMELNGSGHRYGYDEQTILGKMFALGFTTFDYDPFSRKLLSLAGKNALSGNTLFVRDVEHVQTLLSEAPRRSIHSIQF